MCANRNKESLQNEDFPTQEAAGPSQQGPAEECGSEIRKLLQIQFHPPLLVFGARGVCLKYTPIPFSAALNRKQMFPDGRALLQADNITYCSLAQSFKS